MYLKADQIVSMHKSGYSLLEIQQADSDNPRLEEIAQLLVDEGEWDELEKPRRRTRKDFPAHEIVSLYKQYNTLTNIAVRYKTTTTTIRSILKDEGVFSAKPVIKLTEADKREICLQYRHGASLRTLGIRFYTTAPTITRILYEREIPMRKAGRPVMANYDEQKLRKIYESGVCVAEIAQDYKVPESQIRRALKRGGTVMRPVGSNAVLKNRFKTW